tara:strand:+ start:255 stop:404 length:150 start_codon:yes stop_codon:yes gene_type:complete
MTAKFLKSDEMIQRDLLAAAKFSLGCIAIVAVGVSVGGFLALVIIGMGG